VAPDAPSGEEIAWSEDGRHIELERQLSETLVAKTERDRRIAQLTDELAMKSTLLEQAAEEKKGVQRELQSKLDDLLLSRNQALEQARSALQNATEVNERSQQELAEVHAKLEERESELAAVRLRLTDAEVRSEKSKAEADTIRAGTQAAAGLVNIEVDRVMKRLMERVQSVEAEMASLRGNEKSIGEMECRNEG
jgi:chromosome segregation ATPase